MNDGSNSDATATSSAAQRQVRVQLTSKQEDIALPDNTGPILVPTGRSFPSGIIRLNCRKSDASAYYRSATICAFDTGEQTPW